MSAMLFNLLKKPTSGGGGGGAAFTGSGFGDANCNQAWTQAGTYNSQPYYSNASANRINYYSGTTWCIALTLGGGPPYYVRNGSVTGAYTLAAGSSPAGSMA
jgi:hypothetical protein